MKILDSWTHYYYAAEARYEHLVIDVGADDTWAKGDAGMAVFGPNMDIVDLIAMLRFRVESANLAIGQQIDTAIDEGHSWNEIAIALGVSRQAAIKRWGRGGTYHSKRIATDDKRWERMQKAERPPEYD